MLLLSPTHPSMEIRETTTNDQTANLLFLIVAMAILWARSSALATAQYRQLAARIGIPGSGGWRG